MSATFIPTIREQRLSQLIQDFKTQSKLESAQALWQFREFSGFGTFSYNSEFMTTGSNLEITGFEWPEVVLTTYNNNYLESTDGISTDVYASSIFYNATKSAELKTTYLLQERSILLMAQGDTLTIISAQDPELMQEVFGFSDFKGEEKEILKRKKWIQRTMLPVENSNEFLGKLDLESYNTELIEGPFISTESE